MSKLDGLRTTLEELEQLDVDSAAELAQIDLDEPRLREEMWLATPSKRPGSELQSEIAKLQRRREKLLKARENLPQDIAALRAVIGAQENQEKQSGVKTAQLMAAKGDRRRSEHWQSLRDVLVPVAEWVAQDAALRDEIAQHVSTARSLDPALDVDVLDPALDPGVRATIQALAKTTGALKPDKSDANYLPAQPLIEWREPEKTYRAAVGSLIGNE